MKSLFTVAVAILISASTVVSAAYESQDQCYTTASDCCCPSREVTVCCSPYTFEFEARALYFQPYSSDLHYGVEAQAEPLPSPNWFVDDIKPKYHFGFDLVT